MNNNFSNDNRAKSQHGYDAQDDLSFILNEYKNKGYITDVIKEFRIGNPTKTNGQQFYAPFMIQFANRSRWIIFSTTSLRTDRVKGQQWDAFNLKALDSSITTAIITFPNDVSDTELRKFQVQDYKYTNNEELSAIDRILPQNELLKLIENESQNEYYEEIEPGISKEASQNSDMVLDSVSQGQQWDLQGRNFEKQIATCLSSHNNFRLWKMGINIDNNEGFSHFLKIITFFNLNPAQTKEIIATSDRQEIGYLPSGGSPKTDVIATVIFNNGEHKHFTISCKRSTRGTVSIHQYSADTFADVLNSKDNVLRNLLNTFQIFGNIRDLPRECESQLTERLKPYQEKLGLWVLGGIGGSGDIEKHWANYIITYRPEIRLFSIHQIKDYYEELLKKSKLTFGTPFTWTFASGQKGKSIQLKCKML